MHQLENVHFRVLPRGDLDAVGYIAIALLEPRYIAGVHPEHPRLVRSLARLVRILDGELRLATDVSLCVRRT